MVIEGMFASFNLKEERDGIPFGKGRRMVQKICGSYIGRMGGDGMDEESGDQSEYFPYLDPNPSHHPTNTPKNKHKGTRLLWCIQTLSGLDL